ncbi:MULTISPECIES: phosphatase PAP2 family protein [unclassified Leeuwenhoekiella]|uniref:phosphatase PAP2 family protein n=1 Tax=unclassified Leeuwenhoekiella TaxID=2615029 RepID=UPI00048B6184|nr:phosphatase PAP2 family protein [Leeuwenhoekiella sp. MAR_2009_132]MDP5043353.1 phosphatase PAP2 family protein [Leeuwenhoekiella sp.]
MRQSLFEFIKNLKNFLQRKFKQYDSKLPYFITVILALIIVVFCINTFIELTETLKTEILATYDTQITDYVISFRTPLLTQYFVFVTNVGDLYGYLTVVGLATIISYFFFKRWKYVLQTIAVLILASVSNVILKRFIDRARPGIEHLVSVETLSYPSGHAMSAMAFYGFLIYLVFRFSINTFLKAGLILLLAVLILSIGISRIYLGVHFPSDIAGGYIAGFIWVVFCILIFNIIELFRRDPKT